MSEAPENTTQNEPAQSSAQSTVSEVPSRHATKRLTRDTNNKIIGGVCSGIANYFDVDPVLIRVIFAVALFGFGVGPLAYILLLIIVPEAK